MGLHKEPEVLYGKNKERLQGKFRMPGWESTMTTNFSKLIYTIKFLFQNCDTGASLVVQWLKLHASSAGGAGSIPGRGAGIPGASQPKKQNRKQKQYCNKFKKDFKNWSISESLFSKKKTVLEFTKIYFPSLGRMHLPDPSEVRLDHVICLGQSAVTSMGTTLGGSCSMNLGPWVRTGMGHRTPQPTQDGFAVWGRNKSLFLNHWDLGVVSTA